MKILDFFKKKQVSDEEKNDDEQTDEIAMVKKVEDLYRAAYESVKNYHRDWYVNDRFIRGDHYIIFNKTLNTIQTLPVSEGEIRRTINKTRVQVRAVKNFITRSDPTWEVIPMGTDNTAMDEARKGGIVLRYYQNRLNLQQITRSVVTYGVKYSFGIYAIDTEDVDGDGVEDVIIRADDPFDYVLDPSATQLDLSDCRYYIKAIKRPLTAIKNSKLYNKEDNPYKKNLDSLKPDDKYASAEYKDIQLKKQYHQVTGETGDDDLKTILIYELWLKHTDNDGKTKIKVITKAGNGEAGRIIRSEDTDLKHFPIILYAPEVDPGKIYSEPWVKDIISLNKSLDRTISHIESYNKRMLIGRYLMKKGSKVSRITDKHGEFISYEGNVAPSQQRLEPLPSTPFNLVDLMERFIEDIGGVHESSLGRLPGSAQSGRSIEALQAADAANLAEATKNLEKVYSQIGERIFEILSVKQIVSKTIRLVEGDKTQEVTFIGKNVENPPSNAMKIDNFKVKVQIVPGLAYTEEGKRELLFKLAELKVVDPQFVLEQLKTSSIGEIIERMQKQQDKEFVKEGLLREVSVSSKQGMAPGQGVAQNAIELADQENQEMTLGRQIPETPDEFLTPEHHDLHLAFINDPKNADKVARSGGLIEAHIQGEKQRLAVEGASPQTKAQMYA